MRTISKPPLPPPDRFVVEETWQLHNAALAVSDHIHVHVPDEFSSCFARFRFNRGYHLIIEQTTSSSSDEKHFRAVEAPSPATNAKHRQFITTKLSTASFQVVLPPQKDIFVNQIATVACRVQTSDAGQAYDTAWFKGDHQEAVLAQPTEHVHAAVDMQGNTELVISQATIYDSDKYTCRVTSRGGTKKVLATASFLVLVHDPARQRCDAGFCSNNGICTMDRMTGRKSCQCTRLYSGAHCAMTTMETVVPESFNESIEKSLGYLTGAVSFLCAVVSLAVATALLRYVCKRRRSCGDDDDVEDGTTTTQQDGYASGSVHREVQHLK